MADFNADMAAGYGFEDAGVGVGRPFVDPAAPDDAVEVRIPLGMLNRHGLIAGATGTGKTKTLQLLAEQISAAGSPVFAADMKGDLAGLGRRRRGGPARSAERAAQLGHEWTPAAAPVELLSLSGGRRRPAAGVGGQLRPDPALQGARPQRDAGVDASRWSSASATRRGCCCWSSRTCGRRSPTWSAPRARPSSRRLGGLSKATVGVLQRKVSELESQGGDAFFGEPEFDVTDLLRTSPDGRGVISLLELADVAQRPDPVLDLPDVGPGRALPGAARGRGPREAVAGLLLRRSPPALRRRQQGRSSTRSTQTVRLIRSKGVGVFFVTQLPTDVPDDVLAQLGNRGAARRAGLHGRTTPRR